MLHSTKISQLLVMAVAVLCSCSQADDIAVSDSNEPVKEGTVVFQLQSNTTNATRSAEDSYDHVQGSVDEYKVNVARVYLFDNITKLFVKSVPLTNLTRQWSVTLSGAYYSRRTFYKYYPKVHANTFETKIGITCRL